MSQGIEKAFGGEKHAGERRHLAGALLIGTRRQDGGAPRALCAGVSVAGTCITSAVQTTDTVPPNLIYELPTILSPMEVAAVFPKTQPLEVELGCGDATFLVNYAKLHPERNFLGIERLNGRIRKLDRKGRRLGLGNVRGVRIESVYFLEYLLPKSSTTALHIYFPDPWPKRRHWKNRLINEQFPQLAHSVLSSGGIVYLRTDDQTYFDQMKRVFGASPLFQMAETPDELSAIVTDFEKDFNARGIGTLRAAYLRD